MHTKLYSALFCLLFLVLISPLTFSQNMGGLNFNYNQALNEFKHNINSSPVGISLNGFYAIPNTHLFIGAELGVSMFANEEYTKDLTEEGYANAMVNVYEEDCYVSYYAVTRYHLSDTSLFIPYIEGKIGGISFFNDKIYDEPYGPGAPEKIENKMKFLGTSFQYGIGAGTLVQLNPLFSFITDQLFLDLGFTIFNGSKTNYRSVNYTEEIVRSNNDVEYRSKTNNIAYSFGLMYRF